MLMMCMQEAVVDLEYCITGRILPFSERNDKKEQPMRDNDRSRGKLLPLLLALPFCFGNPAAAEEPRIPNSYSPVVIDEDFETIRKQLSGEKQKFQQRHQKLLESRYDLSNRPAKETKMTRGKAIQEGVRVKLPKGMTWEKLAALSPEEIREKDLFPQGFLPLPHPKHEEGGMVFPKFQIEAVQQQGLHDLNRFDIEFGLPEHFLPEFPPAIFLTTRPDLGDVSKGQLITINNYFETFNGILNPKQLEGLRLLVSQFPQQQFNATNDRRSDKPSQGVTCFDCHANGHTNAATHLIGDIRPQERRLRIDTPSLRG